MNPSSMLFAKRILYIATALMTTAILRINAQSASAESSQDDPVELSPFEVTSGSNVGYGAKTAISSSRLNLAYTDVPQTVSTVTSEFLEDAYITDSREFVKYVPNINARTNAHQVETFYIRGLQTTSSYVNGFKTSFAVNRDSALYDRVEYVKGPASAAIGRGEAGGLVNFIAKAPNGQEKTKIRLTAGTDTFGRAEVDHGGILDEGGKLTYRVAGYFEDSEAIRGGNLMPTEKYGIGPSLIWRIAENTRVDVNAAIFHHRTPGNVASAHWMVEDTWKMYTKMGIVDPAVWNPQDFPLLPSDRVFGFPEAWRDVNVYELDVALAHRFNEIVSFRQAVRLDTNEEEYRRHSTPPSVAIDPSDPSKRLVSVTYRREFHSNEGARAQGDLLFDFEIANTDQELVLGYEYSDQSGWDATGQRGGLSQDMYNPSYAYPTGFDPNTYIQSYTSDLNTRADGFGYYFQYKGSYWEDRINVIYGWRKDETSNSVYNNRTNTETSPLDQTTDVPRYSISYKPVPWASFYYLHSEQADPSSTTNRYGNWQAIGGATLPPASDPRYDELLTTAVTAQLDEFGVKANFFDERLFLSAVYFDMTREGNRTNVLRAEPGANGIGTVQFNDFFVGSGELIDGIELEVFGQPTDRLTFYAALALPNGSKPRSDGSRGGIEALGDTFSAHGKYSFRDEHGNGFEMTAGGKVWFKGWTMSESVDYEFSKDQYSIDFGGSYYFNSGNYGVHLKVNNVFDEFIYVTANSQWGLRRAYLSFSTEF